MCIYTTYFNLLGENCLLACSFREKISSGSKLFRMPLKSHSLMHAILSELTVLIFQQNKYTFQIFFCIIKKKKKYEKYFTFVSVYSS